MLEIKRLNQYYGESRTLQDISFNLAKQDCMVVMGRNGVGKTTLVESIMGMLDKVSGQILLHGQDIIQKTSAERAKLKVGYVPQGRCIFPLLTVEENLRIGLPMTRQKTIPSYIYELFPVLKTMLNRLGGDLSGGQQQQLAIARALVIEPEILILDEPTEGIQPNIIKDICKIIWRLNKEFGLTVLLVEQKLPIARSIADKFIILNRGKVVAEGNIACLEESTIKQYLTV